jgi:hypothetical protein
MSGYQEFLGIVANYAAIATALVAVTGYGLYRLELRRKRRLLEDYLRERKAAAKREGRKGQHTVLHLMAKLRLSETEVFQASFRSRKVRPVLATDRTTGHARDILFEYDDGSEDDAAPR